jgi:lipopolysaccharide export system permease protein
VLGAATNAMRILTRYIFKEVFSHSLIGLLVFTFVIFVKNISMLLELVVRHNLDPLDILTLFALPIPGILVLTVPMAVLVGTLIGLSRMAADGEVIAARATGVGIRQFVKPVMLFAVLGWGVTACMSLSLAPRSARKLISMEDELKTSQVSYEIKPRVFIEQFPNLLLYLEDVTGASSRWRGVFIADNSKPDSVKVTLAESGMLVNDANHNRLDLHLTDGMTHEINPQRPEQYSVISFNDSDIPLQVESSGNNVAARKLPAMMSTGELLRVARGPSPPKQKQAALVELNYRLALPFASIVLALVGISLGMSTRKGGKAVGLILTIILVFIYYILMASGLSLAKQGRVNPYVGLWSANLVFGAAGIYLVLSIQRVRSLFQNLQEWMGTTIRRLQEWVAKRRLSSSAPVRRQPLGGNVFQILDAYIIRSWLFYFALMLITFTGIYMIFDFFQLLGDVVRNHIAGHVVLDYYRYLTPQIVYLMLPLSILMATLVNFGLLSKTNQITAIKAAGISLYRLSAPILIVSALLSASMFLLQDNYLPETNQRQDALRNQIKGKPAQTYYRPDRLWIFGQGSRIYNYRFFDPDHNVFANLSVFEIDTRTFRITKRIYAERAMWEDALQGWVLENGWVRTLDADRVVDYMPFSVAKFDELTEPPAYFKREVKPSEQMTASELRAYIHGLAQSGFDVIQLNVQLYRKFAYPLIAFVIALIAIPFSFTTGARGALTGIALSIGIAIIYWSASSLLEAMGNLNQLPPLVAAFSPDVFFGLGGIYLLLKVRT